MTKIVMYFETGNAAFEDNPDEIEEMLQRATKRVADEPQLAALNINLKDYNGSTVGYILASDDEIAPIDGYVMEIDTDESKIVTPKDLAEALNKVAARIYDGMDTLTIYDAMGKSVGSIEQTQEEPAYRPRP